MKRTITFLCLCTLTGCTTVGPVQKRAEQIRIPEVGFRDAAIADVIVFLVEEVNRPRPPPVSVGLIQQRDPGEETQRRQKFASLYRLCENKTINLNGRDWSLMQLVQFAANRADLRAEFRNDELVIVTKTGDVVMR